MADRASADKLHLGFLHVVSLEAGFVGGLLVTNRIGRPLEFQCTTPVRPNRTQELLYGTSLESFVYCEVIARTLLERTAVKPDALLINQSTLMALRENTSIPVVQLPDEPRAGHSALDTAVTHPDIPADAEWIERLRKVIPASADLHEPLERVKDALAEALRSAA